LFKILTTLITPMSGTARVAGGDVVAERNRVRGRIGIVFQKPSLDGKLTVLENLVVGTSIDDRVGVGAGGCVDDRRSGVECVGIFDRLAHGLHACQRAGGRGEV
jgi:ABC-type uncharacterized transport system ATPase subunit